MIAKLLTKFLGFILSIIGSLVSIILSPITSVISSNMPDLHNSLTTIQTFINNYVVKGFTYFPSFLGPLTKGAIRLEFDIIAIFFTIYAVYVVVYASFRIIAKIKSMFL